MSSATVYRHVATLLDAGILELAGEHRVRRFVERRYRLNRPRAAVTPSRAAAASIEDHRRAFTTATAVLLAEYGTYLDSSGADPAADLVGYRQHAVWLTDAERNALIEGMRAAIVPVLANEPDPGRRPYLLSPILFPVAPGSAD